MKTDTEEIWKRIPLAGGNYEASNLGRVRSFHRSSVGTVLRPTLGPNGSYTVSLSEAGFKYSTAVARAVALAFLGDPPDAAMDAQHISTDIADDSLKNIRWGYRRDHPVRSRA